MQRAKAFLFVALGILALTAAFAPACLADISLEVGNASIAGINYEWSRVTLGGGLNVAWFSRPDIVGFSESGLTTTDVSVIVIEPAVSARWFLNESRTARPFLSARVFREIPIANSNDPDLEEDYRQRNDDWSYELGAGLRAFLSERVSLAGEAGVLLRVATVEGSPTDTYGGGVFRVSLLYHL